MLFFYYRKSLKFFRGTNYDVTKEINEIKERHAAKQKIHGESKSWMWTFQRLLSPSFCKPFLFIGLIYMLIEWAGFNNILVYMILILQESESSIDPELGPIIVGSVRLIASSKCLKITFIWKAYKGKM